VVVAGVGGLGSVVAEALVRAGIGKLCLVDYDVVSVSDLNRQILYSHEDLGIKKVDAATKRLLAIRPDVEIVGVQSRITSDFKWPVEPSIVADCLDNFDSRFALDEICRRQEVALVHGGIDGLYGQVCTILPDAVTRLPNLFKGVGQKSTPAALGAGCMVVGGIQALEVMNFILKGTKGLSTSSTLLAIDLHEFSIERLQLA